MATRYKTKQPPSNTTDITKVPGENMEGKKLIVNEIILRNVDRTPKDIRSWRDALINAESIYYPNRTRLYDLYLDVLLDGHLSGIINKRIDAFLNKVLRFKKDDSPVEELETLIKKGIFRRLVKEIWLWKLWGISGFEFIPGPVFNYEVIPRKHIKPELGVIAPEQSYYEGVPYEGVSNVWIIGDKRDYGILLQCAPYALFKKGGFADWAQFVEIFGQPIRVYKYDSNDQKTVQELKKEMDTAGGSLSIAIPKLVDFDILDGKISNGDGQLQERLKNACNDEMSIVILGNTETTNSNHGGSNAKAQEHGKQQMEITKADMQDILDQLNSEQFLAILKSYGYPVDGGAFVYEKEVDLIALSQKIEIDMQVATKEPIAADYWYETYGITKPDNYDQLKQQMQQQQQDQANPNNKPAGGNKAAGEDDSVESSPVVKPPVQAKNLQKPKMQLSAWQKFRLSMADFFDPAPLK